RRRRALPAVSREPCMRSASSKALMAGVVAALAAIAPALPRGDVHQAPSRQTLLSFAQRASAPLNAAGVRRLASVSWSGGPITAADGETMTIFVSDSYVGDPSIAQ